MTSRWRIPVAALALALGCLTAAVGPADASQSAHGAAAQPTVGTIHPRGVPAGFNPGGATNSVPGALAKRAGTVRNAIATRNWSGYVSTGANGSYTGVSAQWRQSGLNCTDPNSVQYVSFWVGLDGFNGSSVEQTGTLGICDGTTPLYYAWYEMYPAPPVYYNVTVGPGNIMYGAVIYDGNDNYTLNLSLVNGNPFSESVTVNQPGLARSSAEVITEAPSISTGIAPLASFSPAWYRTAFANGAQFNVLNPTPLVIADAAGNLQDTTSSMNTGNSGFINTWISSS
ncbi:G1 family glutamic endopeptidase [Actinocrinis sp.]|uniref:G1 family glutamic endopeptidase n=1 Tax=Actinocrinis sp. TaxID=1920516 RepID=UPI002D6E5F8E|nr:G1 family glutamic endopeptidase [Actinocrinis sp.]HZP50745.1 G1 family glutamic endopeptidase [Actinocrinis sp.]